MGVASGWRYCTSKFRSPRQTLFLSHTIVVALCRKKKKVVRSSRKQVNAEAENKITSKENSSLTCDPPPTPNTILKMIVRAVEKGVRFSRV